VTKDEALDVWRKGMGGPVEVMELLEVDETISRWLSRGDQILIYQNVELGHPEAGHVQMTSYGSGLATIKESVYERPPTTMPDFPGQINWRYQLIGIVEP
jgi:hypothetical protein